MLQGLVTDLRYAGRMSRRVPVVTISVTLVIALGIAASTAIFSVMEGVFLRPLPFPCTGPPRPLQHNGRESRQRPRK